MFKLLLMHLDLYTKFTNCKRDLNTCEQIVTYENDIGGKPIGA